MMFISCAGKRFRHQSDGGAPPLEATPLFSRRHGPVTHGVRGGFIFSRRSVRHADTQAAGARSVGADRVRAGRFREQSSLDQVL